ncbi:MAG: DUF1592 domain-containing protein [Bryobacteraceae bacterium]
MRILGVLTLALAGGAAEAAEAPKSLEVTFEQVAKPFLTKHCVSCHNVDKPTSGVRVDQLNPALEDRHLKLWDGIRHKVANGTMPPKGLPQPEATEKKQMVEWIAGALDVARLRPTPKNGLVRRLTVAQYRNTLRELLGIDDDMTERLPPDAVSKDGFVNNKDTLQLSPLQIEAYLEIAEDALGRAIVDPNKKPSIQNFRMDLGASINPSPLPEKLILGADSLLLENKDFTVTQLKAVKPFPFEPFWMRTKYRFIEGYQGNDTVRGWREYDSIYHSVFACMRGNHGYPKGQAYGSVPQGLLLRPAIPTDELFGIDSTYGPKANFKISLRELPDYGKFRVTVTAARYDDGLLLDPGAKEQPAAAGQVTARIEGKPQTVAIPQAGVYQVDIHAAERKGPPAPDSSRLSEGLASSWPLDGDAGTAKLEGKAKFVDSPFGKAVSLDGAEDRVTVPRGEAVSVGAGDFTFAAWIHPKELRRAAIVSAGGQEWVQGWNLVMPNNRGSLRFETSKPDTQPNGTVSTPAGVLRAGVWQHVAAVVRRGKGETVLYINGYAVAKGEVGAADLDNPKLALSLGRMGGAAFQGEIDEARLYRRALSEAEISALVQPGKQFADAPPEKPQDVTLTLGDREFSGTLQQAAFAVIRLGSGPVTMRVGHAGVRGIDRVVFTPLAAQNETAKRFLAFEKRSPKLGVYLGLRRDCGSTLAPVGPAKAVTSAKLAKFVYQGAIRNFPSPDVEKDNVNYLAGVREIGVRSEFTDGRDMPRLLIRSVEFEGPFYESWPPPSHKAIFVDYPRKDDQAAYARHVIRNFATRAFRRPVTVAEEASLVAVYEKSAKDGRAFQQSVKDALAVALTSPQFLFLSETSATPKPEPLTDHELASKLSYFLWNGPPDRTTLGLAASGTLRSRIDAEVDRMVADRRFSQFTREFAAQWLSLDKFQVLEPDLKRYPKLTRDNRAQLKQEPVQFVEYLIRNNLPVKNLIASDFVMLNEVTANYYDMADKSESGFQFVPVAHGRRELGGVLTQAAIMAGLSDGRESNPVKRGAWLARKIVAEPPDDPPPNVPALKDDPNAKLTLRQRIEQHRSQPGCRQCHTKIDPWGVAFEEFDAGGRLKKEQADARSTLPDSAEVAGIEDLKRHLSQDRIDQIAFSVLKHMATYATGRTLAYNEVNALKKDALKLKANGYRMKDMVHYVATSNFFLEK